MNYLDSFDNGKSKCIECGNYFLDLFKEKIMCDKCWSDDANDTLNEKYE